MVTDASGTRPSGSPCLTWRDSCCGFPSICSLRGPPQLRPPDDAQPSSLAGLHCPRRSHCFLLSSHTGHFEIITVTFLGTFLKRISKASLVSPVLLSDFTFPWLLVPFELSEGVCFSSLAICACVVTIQRHFRSENLRVFFSQCCNSKTDFLVLCF